MTTIEYRGWARYASTHGGDIRVQHILSTIGSMLANTWRKQGSPTIPPSAFSPWGPWPEDDGADRGGGLLDAYGDPLMAEVD